MPQGDWHPASRLRHGIINIQVTDDGEVHHIGMGYDVVSPNGSVLRTSGWSWPISTELRKRLEEVLREMAKDVVDHEGVSGLDYQTFPDPTPERIAVEIREGLRPDPSESPTGSTGDMTTEG